MCWSSDSLKPEKAGKEEYIGGDGRGGGLSAHGGERKSSRELGNVGRSTRCGGVVEERGGWRIITSTSTLHFGFELIAFFVVVRWMSSLPPRSMARQHSEGSGGRQPRGEDVEWWRGGERGKEGG